MGRSTNILDMSSYRRKEFHNPLFNNATDDFDDIFIEKNVTVDHVLDNYYVDTRTEKNFTNERIFSLFTSQPKEIKKAMDLASNIVKNPGMVYMLLAKKGHGKTITLRQFKRECLSDKKHLPSEKCGIAYVDLKTKKSDKNFLNNLPGSLMIELFYTIKRKVKILSPFLNDPTHIKRIDECYNFLPDEVLIQSLLNNKEEALEFLFSFIDNSEYDLYIIIDNVDDFPVVAINSLIDKCVELKTNFNLKCIIALRDYWSPKNLNITDTNICSCYLNEPDIYKIILRRLENIDRRNISSTIEIQLGNHKIQHNPDEIVETLENIVKDISSNKELHEELFKLSNYNTREHLHNIYHFFHSPYLYSKPIFIKSIIEKMKIVNADIELEPPRKTRFHDFIECFMAIHSLCYDIESSKIFNIFFHDYTYQEGYSYKNVLLYIRVLQSLPLNQSATDKKDIIIPLESVGYSAKTVKHAINKLLENALIESMEGVREEDVNEVFLSSKGKIYIENLVYEFSYLVFISDAVPMPDKYKVDIVEKFGGEDVPLDRGSLALKHDSVIRFIQFIESEEKTEYNNCPPNKHDILKRITYNEPISLKMREDVDYTISRMLKSGKKKGKRINKATIIEG